MTQCLIFPYGGTTKWLDLSLRNYPEISWVVVVSNSNQRTTDEPNRVEDCKKYIALKKLSEAQLPIPAQRKYDILEIPEYDFFYQNLSFFRSLVQYIRSCKVDEIIIHLNSGPMVWRIALYQCAEEFKDLIKFIFVFNKISGKEEKIRLYRELNDVELNLIQLLSKESKKIPLTQLWTDYAKLYPSKSLSHLLKTINRLSAEGIIIEIKEGREKLVVLSEIGICLYKNQELIESIKQQLSTNEEK
jgi:hypothetical protein